MMTIGAIQFGKSFCQIRGNGNYDCADEWRPRLHLTAGSGDLQASAW